MHWRRRAAILVSLPILVLGCGGGDEDYVHVVIEGSSPDLSSAPVTVETAVFGGGTSLEVPFTAELRVGVPGSAPDQTATDFNLVVDDAIERVDLRVAIATPSTRWSASVVLVPPLGGATRRLVLQPGDNSLGTARLGVDRPGSVARYRAGLATLWSSTEGVSLRIDGNPAEPLGRPETLDADNASSVRIASPAVTGGAGPELLAAVWRDSRSNGRLLFEVAGDRIDAVSLGPVAELDVTCPRVGAAAAVLVRNGAAADLSYRDATGAELSSVRIASDARAIRAVVTGDFGEVVGLRRERWSLVRVAGGQVVTTRDVDELLAVAPSASTADIVTVEIVDDVIAVRTYRADSLEPTGETALTASSRRPDGLFGSLDVAACGVTWPEPRDDGTGSVDLWFRELNAAGVPVGAARILPGAWRGSHLAPRLLCAEPGVAYAIFAVATELQARDGTLALRRVPEPPP